MHALENRALMVNERKRKRKKMVKRAVLLFLSLSLFLSLYIYFPDFTVLAKFPNAKDQRNKVTRQPREEKKAVIFNIMVNLQVTIIQEKFTPYQYT